MIRLFKNLRQAFFKKINRNFYSQFGEDKILSELIPSNKISGFYVDVGCFHPKKHSNTYFLYKRGWRGVNIDMEEEKIDVFNLARPKDFNYLAAISDINEEVYIYRTQKFGVGSTIDKSILKDESKIIDKKIISTKTLNQVLEISPFKNIKIDLLNIDTEGYDLKVLLSLDLFIYSPSIIVIETHLEDINQILKSKIYRYLVDKNYKLKSWNLYSLIFISNS